MEETRKIYMKSDKNWPDFLHTTESEKKTFDQETHEISAETMNLKLS